MFRGDTLTNPVCTYSNLLEYMRQIKVGRLLKSREVFVFRKITTTDSISGRVSSHSLLYEVLQSHALIYRRCHVLGASQPGESYPCRWVCGALQGLQDELPGPLCGGKGCFGGCRSLPKLFFPVYAKPACSRKSENPLRITTSSHGGNAFFQTSTLCGIDWS